MIKLALDQQEVKQPLQLLSQILFY